VNVYIQDIFKNNYILLYIEDMNKNKFYNPDIKFKKDLKWYQKIRSENKQREKACKDYYGPNFKYNKPSIDPYIYPGVNTYKLMHPFELNNDNCQIKRLPPKIIEKGNNYYTNIDNKDDCDFYKGVWKENDTYRGNLYDNGNCWVSEDDAKCAAHIDTSKILRPIDGKKTDLKLDIERNKKNCNNDMNCEFVNKTKYKSDCVSKKIENKMIDFDKRKIEDYLFQYFNSNNSPKTSKLIGDGNRCISNVAKEEISVINELYDSDYQLVIQNLKDLRNKIYNLNPSINEHYVELKKYIKSNDDLKKYREEHNILRENGFKVSSGKKKLLEKYFKLIYSDNIIEHLEKRKDFEYKTQEDDSGMLPSVSQSVINKIMHLVVDGKLNQRGILGWHSTGSGKLCVATGVMESFWETDRDIIYASSLDAINSNPDFKFHECAKNLFPYFKKKYKGNNDKDTLSNIEKAFKKRKVRFFSFAKLSNRVRKTEYIKKNKIGGSGKRDTTLINKCSKEKEQKCKEKGEICNYKTGRCIEKYGATHNKLLKESKKDDIKVKKSKLKPILSRTIQPNPSETNPTLQPTLQPTMPTKLKPTMPTKLKPTMPTKLQPTLQPTLQTAKKTKKIKFEKTALPSDVMTNISKIVNDPKNDAKQKKIEEKEALEQLNSAKKEFDNITEEYKNILKLPPNEYKKERKLYLNNKKNNIKDKIITLKELVKNTKIQAKNARINVKNNPDKIKDEDYIDLNNSILIIDEVHNLFRPLQTQKEEHLYLEKLLIDPTIFPNLKIVILTATPGDNLEDVLKLINILRDPNMPQIVVPDLLNDISINKFKYEIRGLVSFFDMSNDLSKFPLIIDNPPEKYPMGLKQYEKYVDVFKDTKDSVKNFDILAKKHQSSKYWIQARRYSNSLYNFEKDMNLHDFSGKMPHLFEKIQQNINEKHYIYSAFYENRGHGGHGILAIAKELEKIGYKKLSIEEAKNYNDTKTYPDMKDRYVLAISSEISKYGVKGGEYMNQIIKFYNSKENKNGDYVRIFLASQNYNEGIDLRGVRNIHIFEPLVTWASDKQTLGRAARYCSHSDLNKENNEWKVNIHRYISDFPIELKTIGDYEEKLKELEINIEKMNEYILELDKKADKDEIKAMKQEIKNDNKIKKELIKKSKQIDKNIINIEDKIFKESKERLGELFILYQIIKESAIDCKILEKFHNINNNEIKCTNFLM
jgi:hypothetical protein